MSKNANEYNRIHVAVSRPYDVLVGPGLLQRVPELIRPLGAAAVAIVTDDTVRELYGETLKKALEKSGFSTCLYAFPHGEAAKNMGTLADILEFLAGHRLTRGDLVLALGGGVVGDVAGLAAALYLRGVRVVQIPTTLLSATDASVGGKTAVDLSAGKNLAGAFHQPSLVITDTDVIRQLPDDIRKEGMAEIIKCDVIGDLGLTPLVTDGTLVAHIDDALCACIGLKRGIVETDEFETLGRRQLLNAGHTVAHGIEKLSRYAVSHGPAVGTGLVAEANIARLLSLTDDATVEKIRAAVEKAGLLAPLPDAGELVAAMRHDKKNTDDDIAFVLPVRFGHCVIQKLTPARLTGLLREIGGHL